MRAEESVRMRALEIVDDCGHTLTTFDGDGREVGQPGACRDCIAAALRAAVAEEREACAKIAETPIAGEQDDLTMEAKDRIARTLRTRPPGGSA